MKVKSIKGTRDTIKVLFDDGKCIILTGELTTIPDFYADISSIQKWESPFDNEFITNDTKEKIIKAIKDYSKQAEVKIVLE